MTVSIDDFDRLFPDEVACLAHVATVRFGPRLSCPKCAVGRLYRGPSRPKRLICDTCQRDTSIGGHTVFDHCRGSFRDLMYLMLIVANSTAIVSISFVERHFGISRMAAYRMLMLIRAHMAGLSDHEQRGGCGKTVQIDETWCSRMRVGPSGARQGVIIFGIIDEDGANVQLVTSRRRSELFPIILSTVRPGSLIVTDQHPSYASLGKHGFKHVALNHSRGQWADQSGRSSAMIESYWTSLKYFLRFANGSIHDSQLPLYLAEHVFKFNARRSGGCAFAQMIGAFPELDRSVLPRTVTATRNRHMRLLA